MSLEDRLSELESRMTSIETRLGIVGHRRPTESLRDGPPSAEGWRPSSDLPSSERAERPAVQPGRKIRRRNPVDYRCPGMEWRRSSGARRRLSDPIGD